MIERYSRKQMADIWSDHNKFSIWLEIEILACEAQHKLGLIPLSAIRNIKKESTLRYKRNTKN